MQPIEEETNIEGIVTVHQSNNSPDFTVLEQATVIDVKLGSDDSSVEFKDCPQKELVQISQIMNDSFHHIEQHKYKLSCSPPQSQEAKFQEFIKGASLQKIEKKELPNTRFFKQLEKKNRFKTPIFEQRNATKRMGSVEPRARASVEIKASAPNQIFARTNCRTSLDFLPNLKIKNETPRPQHFDLQNFKSTLENTISQLKSQQQKKRNPVNFTMSSNLLPPRARERSPKPIQKILFNGMETQLRALVSEGNENPFNQATYQQVTMPVIETWLNETLREAEFFGIPSTFQKSQKSGAKAIYDYSIDRMSLSQAGIGNNSIDTLYRSLFVNTMGFFGNISEIVNKQANCMKLKEKSSRHQSKGSIISAVWRVYQILMEFSYSTNYKSQIIEIINESKKILKEKNDNFEKMMKLEEKKQEGLRTQLEYVENCLKQKQHELQDQKNKYASLKEDFRQQALQHEQEVGLRMQFEERLNNLHALNRSFNDVAESNDIKIRDRDNQIEQLREINQELSMKLRAEKIECQKQSFSRILAEDTIKSKQNEITNNNNFMSSLREKYEELQEENIKDKQSIQRLTKEVEISKNQIKEISAQTTISTKNENELRVMTMEQQIKISVKDIEIKTYKEQVRDMQKQIDGQMQTINDLEQKIEDFEKELFQANLTRKQAEEAFSQRIIDIEKLQSQFHYKDQKYIQLDQEYAELSQKIKRIDDEMFNIYQREVKLKQDLAQTQNELKISRELNVTFKEKNNELEIIINGLSSNIKMAAKKLDQKIIDYDSLDRTSTDRILFLEELEKKHSRDINQLQSDLEIEMKKNVKHENEHLKNRQQITLLNNRVKFLECDIRVKSEEVNILNDKKVDLTNQNQNNIIIGDSLKRSLLQEKQNSVFIEKIKQEEYNRLIIEFKDFKAFYQKELMIIEDYFSQLVLREETISKQKDTIQDLIMKLDYMTNLQNETQMTLTSTMLQLNEFRSNFSDLQIEKKNVDRLYQELREDYQFVKSSQEDFQKQSAKNYQNYIDEKQKLEELTKIYKIVANKLSVLENKLIKEVGTQRTIRHDPQSPPRPEQNTILFSFSSAVQSPKVQNSVGSQSPQSIPQEVIPLEAIPQDEKNEQFPYILRFPSSGVQCNLMTEEKIKKSYKTILRDELKAELHEEIRYQIEQEIEVEIRDKVQKEIAERRTPSISISGEEEKDETLKIVPSPLSPARSVEGSIMLKKPSSKRSRRVQIPEALFNQISQCESECCDHKKIIKYMEKANKPHASFYSSHDPEMATDDSINDSLLKAQKISNSPKLENVSHGEGIVDDDLKEYRLFTGGSVTRFKMNTMYPIGFFNNSSDEMKVDTLMGTAQSKKRQGAGLYTKFGESMLVQDQDYKTPAPLTALSISNWKTGQSIIANLGSTSRAKKARSKTRQGAEHERKLNTSRMMRKSSIQDSNMEVQGKQTSLFDDQYTQGGRCARGDIRPIIKGAYSRK